MAISIKSYHDGELMDEMILDFTVIVEDDPDLYPEIEIENVTTNQLIPVNVGDTMRLEITASDPDSTQEIEINSSCGLYDYFNNPATFEAVTNGNTGTAEFEWIVLEEHVREQPYQVVIKVNDNDSLYSKTSLMVVCYQFEEFITNTKNVENHIEFTLFPNPANGKFVNLILENYDADIKQFTIYNSQGRIVKTGNIYTDFTPIDIHSFDSGIYFLQVETYQNTIVKTFVVN